jgi:hypothetical protein
VRKIIIAGVLLKDFTTVQYPIRAHCSIVTVPDAAMSNFACSPSCSQACNGFLFTIFTKILEKYWKNMG